MPSNQLRQPSQPIPQSINQPIQSAQSIQFSQLGQPGQSIHPTQSIQTAQSGQPGQSGQPLQPTPTSSPLRRVPPPIAPKPTLVMRSSAVSPGAPASKACSPAGLQSNSHGLQGNFASNMQPGSQGGLLHSGSQGNFQVGSQGGLLQSGSQGNFQVGPQENFQVGPQGNFQVGPRGNLQSGPQNNVQTGFQNNMQHGTVRNWETGLQRNAQEGVQRNSQGAVQTGLTGLQNNFQGGAQRGTCGSTNYFPSMQQVMPASVRGCNVLPNSSQSVVRDVQGSQGASQIGASHMGYTQAAPNAAPTTENGTHNLGGSRTPPNVQSWHEGVSVQSRNYTASGQSRNDSVNVQSRNTTANVQSRNAGCDQSNGPDTPGRPITIVNNFENF